VKDESEPQSARKPPERARRLEGIDPIDSLDSFDSLDLSLAAPFSSIPCFSVVAGRETQPQLGEGAAARA
jgi:hypothetical protein